MEKEIKGTGLILKLNNIKKIIDSLIDFNFVKNKEENFVFTAFREDDFLLFLKSINIKDYKNIAHNTVGLLSSYNVDFVVIIFLTDKKCHNYHNIKKHIYSYLKMISVKKVYFLL